MDAHRLVFSDIKNDFSSFRLDPTGADKSMVIVMIGIVTIGGMTRAYNQVLINYFVNVYMILQIWVLTLVFEDGYFKIKNDTYRFME
jgi:hypothetical protein